VVNLLAHLQLKQSDPTTNQKNVIHGKHEKLFYKLVTTFILFADFLNNQTVILTIRQCFLTIRKQ